MPNKQLKTPPLIYVLAQVKISPIEIIKEYIPKLQEAVRKRNFPNFNKTHFQNIEIKKNNDINVQGISQWHFKDKNSLTGIVIDKQTINFHTCKYNGFNKFKMLIKEILEIFNKELGVSLSNKVGLRYINVIKSNLKHHVEPSLLGFYEESNAKFLSNVGTFYETKSGFIRIRATHSRAIYDNNIEHNKKIIPHDFGYFC